MKTRHQVAAYAGLLGMTTLIAILLSIRDRLIAIGPWVLGALLAVIGLVMTYYLHKLYVSFRKDRLALQARMYEVEGQKQTLRLESERWDAEKSYRQAEITRIQSAEAERLRLQWQAQDLVKLRSGEVLMQRFGDRYEPVYQPPQISRYVSSNLVDDEEDDEMPSLEELRRPVPDALSLIQSKQLPPGDDVMLGFDEQRNAVVRTWKQIKAILVLGLQGGGKTTTALWLILQMVVKGARLGVIDKHAQKEDSFARRIRPLSPVFEVPLGGDPRSALRVIAHANKMLYERMAGRLPCSYPFVLVIDEFTRIMGDEQWAEVAAKLASLLEAYNSEGRGHRCFAICIGQASNASRTGGTEVRDLFNTRLVHRMRVKQAQMLSLTEYQAEIARLQMGEVFIDMETDEPFSVTVPNVTEEAMQEVARQLALHSRMQLQGPNTEPRLEVEQVRTDELLEGADGVRTPVRTGNVKHNNAQGTHRGAHLSQRLSDKAGKVLELKQFNPTMGKHTIVPEVWKISKGGSAQYKAACDEYDRIIRFWTEQGELQV